MADEFFRVLNSMSNSQATNILFRERYSCGLFERLNKVVEGIGTNKIQTPQRFRRRKSVDNYMLNELVNLIGKI